jgi:MOSC domain-containing protein YiiM/ribosomal protein S18 acetylase RimI-like enzyme
MAVSGRVVQVNVSSGGVPKLPVGEAWVSTLGVAGDGHNDRTTHGGPHRAVCLFGIEAIERLQAEGHPVGPGGVGENLTTEGIEWSLLPVGTRARVGDKLLLELADTAGPCATQKPNFSDGRFSRISIDMHPSDARMYARVLEEGTVRTGDPIELLPVAPDSRAMVELTLDRLDWALGKSSLAGWREAEAQGMDIRIIADGELVMAAAPANPGARYNQALGLARLPNLIGDAQRFFDENRTVGWVVAENEPWPGAVADPPLDMFGAAPGEIAEVAAPDGIEMRVDPAHDGHHEVRLVAVHDGQEVSRAWLYVYNRTGWMRGAYVEPAWRGRGLQRALISARARLAEERGCDVVGATAEPGTVSASNMHASGFRRLSSRGQYRYAPPAMVSPAP